MRKLLWIGVFTLGALAAPAVEAGGARTGSASAERDGTHPAEGKARPREGEHARDTATVEDTRGALRPDADASPEPTSVVAGKMVPQEPSEPRRAIQPDDQHRPPIGQLERRLPLTPRIAASEPASSSLTALERELGATGTLLSNDAA